MDTIVLAPIKKGSTSVRRTVTLGDSTATTGAGIAGLVFNSASLTAYYLRDGDAAATQITLVTATVGTWVSGGFKEVAATNMKGTYELGIPNACLATGADYCIIEIRGATALRDTTLIIPLVAVDAQTATNFGLSALPTANPGAAGGVYIAGSNAATTDASYTCTGAFTCGSLIATSGISTGGAFSVGGNFAVSGSFGVGTDFDIGGRFQISDGFIVLPPATVDRPGFDISGNGAGSAMRLTSGLTGKGIEVASTDTALELISSAGNGILASGVTSYGFAVAGNVAFANGLTIGNGLVIDTIQVSNDIELLGAFNMQDVLIQAGLQASSIVTSPGGVAITGSFVSSNASNDIRLGSTERVNIATAVWNLLTTSITVVGSIGKVLMQAITGTGGTSTFTITVTDGTNPLQNVDFSLYDGTTLISRGTTNVTGNFTGSAPNGTYTAALYKGNYVSSSFTRTVTGNGTGTLNSVMALTIISPPVVPVNPELCAVYGYFVDSGGLPLAGIVVTIQPEPLNEVQSPVVTSGGSTFTFDPSTGTTDVNGFVTINVVQTDQLTPQVTYSITSSNGQINKSGVELTGTTKNIATL